MLDQTPHPAEYTLRVKITEKHKEYFLAELLDSNKFWDESDIAEGTIKIARSEQDENYDVGDTVIVTTSHLVFNDQLPPIVHQTNPATSYDVRMYYITSMEPNHFNWRLEYKILFPIAAILFLGLIIFLLTKLALTIKKIEKK